MKAFILLTAVLAVIQALPLTDLEEQQWQNFKEVHGKIYQNQDEENMRKEIFAQNLKKFEEHNKKYEQGLVSYTIGVNQFADITQEEFAQKFRPINVSAAPVGLPFVPRAGVATPQSIDWRQKGAVARVKDQGQCGSCYSFTATAALESHLFLKTGRLVTLSEQNLIDCTGSLGNQGCDGGVADTCYQYVRDNGGIATDQSYPYEGRQGQCRYNPQNSGGRITGLVQMPRGDENALLNAVGTIGPVVVALNSAPFHQYTGGIFDGYCDNTPNKIDHGVVAVGYGTSPDGKDYWIMKNSWGPQWGEQGYIRIIRNQNKCGLTTQSVYPTV